MRKIDFSNKTFSLIDNSKNGRVGTETIFKYSQEGNLVTADYYGGDILCGKIVAQLRDNELHMLYQCLTTDNQLKAGKAIAQIRFNENNKIMLKLNWEWLNGNQENGVSEYLEN